MTNLAKFIWNLFCASARNRDDNVENVLWLKLCVLRGFEVNLTFTKMIMICEVSFIFSKLVKCGVYVVWEVGICVCALNMLNSLAILLTKVTMFANVNAFRLFWFIVFENKKKMTISFRLIYPSGKCIIKAMQNWVSCFFIIYESSAFLASMRGLDVCWKK